MRFRNPMYNSLGMVRKRPGASLRSPFNVGLGSRRPFYPGSADCPEAGETISFENCLTCPKYALWNAQDQIRRCWYEFRSLEARGYYNGTWDDHPENFANEPEVFEEIQARKRLNAEFAEDFEREKVEMARLAEKLARDDDDGEGEEVEPDRPKEEEDEY